MILVSFRATAGSRQAPTMALPRSALLSVLIALSIVCIRAHVADLTPANIADTLKTGKTFVEFYAPWWCAFSSFAVLIFLIWSLSGHCQKLTSTWYTLLRTASDCP